MFAFSWEGATEHCWLLGTVPLLFCFGRIIKEDQWRGLNTFFIGAAIISAWNLYANHQIDKQTSITSPEPAPVAIKQYITGGDAFIALNGAGHRDADYGLLLDILKMTPPSPAISIVDHLIAPANPSKPWQSVMRDRIASTLRTGGRVYVASHLFDEGEYEDLASENDPFAVQTTPQFSSIDGPTLCRQVTALLSTYSMKSSDFRIGSDNYFVIEPR